MAKPSRRVNLNPDKQDMNVRKYRDAAGLVDNQNLFILVNNDDGAGSDRRLMSMHLMDDSVGMLEKIIRASFILRLTLNVNQSKINRLSLNPYFSSRL